MTALGSFSISGKKALVTGAAMGIGKACALALATAGADVAVVDHNAEAGKKTAETLQSMGVEAFFVHCDIADETQVKAMVQTVVNRFGRLDIAVNSAGVGPRETGIEQSS